MRGAVGMFSVKAATLNFPGSVQISNASRFRHMSGGWPRGLVPAVCSFCVLSRFVRGVVPRTSLSYGGRGSYAGHR